MAITDLNYTQQSATLQHNKWVDIPGGDTYSFCWYWIGSETTNMFALDHDTGVVHDPVRGPVGRPYTSCVHPVSNLLYLGIYCGGGAESPVCCYNVVTGVYTYLNAGPSYADSPTYDGPGNNCITYSDETNKRVFYAGTTRAGLWAWDPIESTFHDFGSIDAPVTWRNRYPTAIQVNSTHAYMGIVDSPECYLAVVDIGSDPTSITTKWKGDGHKSVIVYRGTDEHIYVYVKNSADAVSWYDITDLDTPISAPSTWTVGNRGVVAYTGYYTDHSQAFPGGPDNLTFPIYYKKNGDATLYTVTAAVLDVTPYSISAAGLGLDGKLLCFASDYGPVTRLDPVTNDSTQLGVNPSFSGYGVGVDYQRGLEFLGGYSQGSQEYNPSNPWLSGTNPKNIILAGQSTDPINPVAGARYHRNIFRMVDSNIWWGTSFVRGTPPYDSQVVWYNPDDETTGDISWALTQHCRLENCTPNRASTKLLYSAYDTNSPFTGFIAVINVRKKAIVYYITPSGGVTQGRIVSVESSKATTNQFVGVVPLRYVDITVTGGTAPVAGELITQGTSTANLYIAPAAWTGVVRCYFYNHASLPIPAFASGAVSFSGGGAGTITGAMGKCYTTYCVDIRTRAVLWGPTDYVLALTNFGDHSTFDINLGPIFAHGYVWFYSGNNIVKLDPADGAVTTAQPVDYPGQMAWIGDVLYHWDRTTKHIFSITGLV